MQNIPVHLSPHMNDKTHLKTGVHSRGVLPHLKRDGSSYFVTFRQAGTLPRELVLRLKREREQIIRKAEAAKRPLTWPEQEALFQWYSDRVDAYLDRGHGICHLQEPQCAKLMAEALKYFDGDRYKLRAWVVMPNHVHAVVTPAAASTLSSILHTWKSYTAHQIQKLLPEKIAPFWQQESYDHLIRNDDDLHRCTNYTLMNPVNARLCTEPHAWPWSSAHVA